ncbi:hypothetical protein FV228_24390 [Methylobacterium sp. WL18]|nr:hypothetical protein FV228_24390 [Methylobacterium sp. WL18]
MTIRRYSNPLRHPELLRSSREGGVQGSPSYPEGSFGASASLRHLRMRSRVGGSGPMVLS